MIAETEPVAEAVENQEPQGLGKTGEERSSEVSDGDEESKEEGDYAEGLRCGKEVHKRKNSP